MTYSTKFVIKPAVLTMRPHIESTDAKNEFEDFSGSKGQPAPGENPYNALIATCQDDPVGGGPTVKALVCLPARIT